MKGTKVTKEAFTIVGISVRTENKNGKAESDIAQLWKTFINDKISEKIENKISEDVYCMYTDYKTDYRGLYTTIIGCLVSNNSNLSDRLVAKRIPTGDYYVVESEGEIPKCVADTWAEIWLSDKLNEKRNYMADFDVYKTEKVGDVNEIKVITYLSIK